MAERELLLSPQDGSDAVELSAKTYRKRILPKATINYRGRKITFDESYLNDLANSFQQGAYDQVAFMLADTNNSHTLDPERFRGEVQGVEVADDGLYATIQVTPEAAKVLRENPKLGVSARILENYQRSDGIHFPRALQHVLGTLDPVIPGLGTWEEVALSNGVALENVLDLSATSYEELGAESTDSPEKKEEPVASREDYLKQVAESTGMTVEDLESLDMTDEELAIFASAFDGTEATAEAVDDDELIEEPGEDDTFDLLTEDEDIAGLPSEADIEAAVEALSDEELEALAAELGVDMEDTVEPGDGEEGEDTGTTAEAETPEEAPEAELTDAELADRLGTGEFGSGIDEPVADPDLDGLSDAELAEMTQMWEAALEQDEAVDQTAEDLSPEQEAEEVPDVPAAAPEAPVLASAGAVTLSNEAAPEVVALSNQVTALQHQLAQQEFEALKRDYIRQGVPAALVDLARPILVAGPAATLEFSNAVGGIDTVDAAGIVRQLLDSATGYIDLAKERGHAYSPDGDERAVLEAEEDKRLASMWGEQYGY